VVVLRSAADVVLHNRRHTSSERLYDVEDTQRNHEFVAAQLRVVEPSSLLPLPRG